MQNIELKNPTGKIVKKFGFEYGFSNFVYPLPNSYLSTLCQVESQNKRSLVKIKDFDTLNSFETTDLKYDHDLFSSYWTETLAPGTKCFENEVENPKYLSEGLLSAIKYPTGNETKYIYEPNQYFYDNAINFPPEKYKITNRDLQTYEDVTTINFDVQDGNSLGFFTIANNPDETDGASYLEYNVHVAEYYPLGPIYPQNYEPFINFEFTSGVPDNGHEKFLPGQNGYALSGTGGKGTLTIKRIRYKALPIPNFKTGNGVRIKQIDFYDNDILIPTLSKKYSYTPFDNSTITSAIEGLSDEGGSIIYKNVKETNGDAVGYSKYYYKTFEDFPENLDANGKLTDSIKFYNVLVNGVLAKVETFNNNNIMVSEEINDFEFYELNGFYTLTEFVNITRKNAIIKKLTNSSTLYNPSGSTTQISETTRDTKDFNVTYKKSIGADGNITEQFITYPWQYYLIDHRLWDAKLRTIPLISESKINGVTVSKSETKYEDVNNFHPTSQYSYLPDNLNQGIKDVSYDIYDDKGNLVQFTTYPDVGGVGKSTTVIWGYHKTMPIAKIEGVKLSNIPAGLITSIVNASNEDADASTSTEIAKEKLLIDALNNFRNDPAMENFMVSSFTYNPLVGVTNTISANGMMESYVYDSYNRLQTVKDVDGNPVKSYQYNYKH